MRRDDDRGIALIAVIGLGLVMLLMIASGFTAVTTGLRQADNDQDQSGALDAAYAGVQDYLARVNLNPNYVMFGNPAARFSAGSPVTLPSSSTNKAFLVGSNTSDWATVPGSGDLSAFRYEVDNSVYAATGVIRLRSTGRVGAVTRSIVATFRVRGFVDYTYFTDKEIQDPQITGAPLVACDIYAWQGRSDSTCGTIQFSSSDNLNGRVHSNDIMRICGATMNATTAYQVAPYYIKPAGCNAVVGSVSAAALLPLPSTNTSMKADAQCLYTGPTQVTYNADGTMTVVSPWTKYTNLSGSAPTNPTACGSVADLGTAGGATVPQLSANALYVQAVPLDASNPNAWAANARPTNLTCLGTDGSATTANDGQGWSVTTSGAVVRYPLSNETPASGWRTAAGNGYTWSTSMPAYGCRGGDLYTRGKVTVPTTAASANYIYVTGDITYADRTADVLGLVGQNAVLVWNPVGSDETQLRGGAREIDAALMSVDHTFQVQNYDRAPTATRPVLTVFGSIAQKFRGPVGTTGNTGYAKAYSYDPLLGKVSPPFYLAPTAISFLLQRYASVPAAYSAAGASLS